MSTRREGRVPQNLRVWVSGRDANGNQFRQTARVMDVSWLGGRLGGIRCLHAPGEVVVVRTGGRTGEFSVVWIDAERGEAGIRSLNFSRPIWGVPLEPPTPKPFAPQHPAAASPERPAPSLEHQAPRRPAPPPAGTERRYPRHRCQGGAEVRTAALSEAQQRVWATVDDLGLGGCHLKTVAPFPKDTRVDLKLGLDGTEIKAKGVVCSSRPGVGMGIAFLDLEEPSRELLARIAEGLGRTGSPFAAPLS